MELLKFIAEFHKDAERQGPGSTESTLRALDFLPDPEKIGSILDVGCGTGAQTLILAQHTDAEIVAVDILPDFLDVLIRKAVAGGMENRVRIMEMPMEALDLPERSFDVVWAEGSIYHIGFKKGLKEWKRYLKKGGFIVVSEISWLTKKRPAEITNYWKSRYPEISTVSRKIDAAEECGYIPVGHFIVPETDWKDHYYTPLAERSAEFLEKYGDMEGVKEFIDYGLKEAGLYEKYKEFYSYVFYIAKNG